MASDVLLGYQIFEAGAYPFQQYLEAVEIRNSYLAHPKLTPRQVLARGGQLDPEDFEELRVVTVDNAKKLAEAAREMIRRFYGALGKPAPNWAVD